METQNKIKDLIGVNKINYKDISKITTEAETAISDLRNGKFDLAVSLMLDMLSDSRIYSGIQSRISSIFREKIRIKIDDEKEKELSEKILSAISEQELRLFWVTYLFLGVGILKVDWIFDGGIYQPKLTNFLPIGLRYDIQTEEYFLLVQDISEGDEEKRTKEIEELKNVNSIQQAKEQDFKFIKVSDSYSFLMISNGKQGHLWGLIHSLVSDYITAQSTINDLNTWNSDNNGRIWVVKAPSNSDPEDRNSFSRSLTYIKKNSTIICPQGDNEYSSYNVSSIDSSGSSVYQSYLSTLSQCYENYSIAILGGNLTSKVSDGSLAASETHMQVRQEICNSDKEIIFKMLNDTFLKRFAEINGEFNGTFAYDVDNSDLTSKQLEFLSNVLTVNEALNELGKKIDIDALLKSNGISFVVDKSEAGE